MPRFDNAGVRVAVITPDSENAVARARGSVPAAVALVSDPSEQAAAALCGGLAHCAAVLDGNGVVRWAGWSESWSDSPPPEALLQAAYRLRP